MAYPRQRKPALRSPYYVSGPNSRAANDSYELSNQFAREYDNIANRGREDNGAFMRKADKARIKTTARQIRHNVSNPGNDYQYGTREEVAAQHNARYRNIRRAFGMSAG